MWGRLVSGRRGRGRRAERRYNPGRCLEGSVAGSEPRCDMLCGCLSARRATPSRSGGSRVEKSSAHHPDGCGARSVSLSPSLAPSFLLSLPPSFSFMRRRRAANGTDLSPHPQHVWVPHRTSFQRHEAGAFAETIIRPWAGHAEQDPCQIQVAQDGGQVAPASAGSSRAGTRAGLERAREPPRQRLDCLRLFC